MTIRARPRREHLDVAMVGAGHFAGFHADAWNRLVRARLTAIADRDEAKAAAAADRHETALFTDAAAMLDACRPDIVDIVTPPETHKELVALAAERGIDVVCQKPLAPTLEEARAIVALAEEAGIMLVVHENFRFQPWYRAARLLIDQGELGTVMNIGFMLRPGDGRGPEAYLARQPYFQTMKRFLVHETLIHLIDTFRYLLGEIDGVFARLRRLNPAIAGEDAGQVILRFESGAAGLIDANRHLGHETDNPFRTMGLCLIEGTGGSLRLDGRGRLWLRPDGGQERPFPFPAQDRGFGGDCTFSTCAHVLAHLLDGGPLENDGRSYLRNIEIEEAIYRSHDEGRWIDLPR